MMIKQRGLRWLAAALFVVLLAACSGNEGQKAEPLEPGKDTENPPASSEPAEVSVYLLSMPQSNFDYIAEQARSRFPHITLTAVPNTNAGGPTLETMVVAGTVPDLFAARVTDDLVKFDLLYNIEDLIRSHQFDLTRIEPAALEMMRNSSGGYLSGLPLLASVQALHYNKDLFDRFGVEQPQDGMNWDELYEKARRMTRVEDDVLYRGYVERWWDNLFIANPFGETFLSLTEDKAAVNTDGWRRIADNFRRFYTLPGLSFDQTTINKEQDWRVFINGTAGMTIFASRNFMDWNFDWDIVSFPSYPEKPGIGAPASFSNLYLTSTSPNKDAAFQIAAWLLSDEMQALMAADIGSFPVVTSDSVKAAFRQNDPLYKDKNIGAYFHNDYPPVAPARAEGLVQVAATPFMREMEKVIVEGKDINSALRDAEEQLNQAIQTEKSR